MNKLERYLGSVTLALGEARRYGEDEVDLAVLHRCWDLARIIQRHCEALICRAEGDERYGTE